MSSPTPVPYNEQDFDKEPDTHIVPMNVPRPKIWDKTIADKIMYAIIWGTIKKPQQWKRLVD